MQKMDTGNVYFEKLLKIFIEKFQAVKDKRIVLYGIGAFSATVIDTLKDFNIVGLMDRDPENIGKIMYGVPILSKEEVTKYADMIIINTEAGYWQTIYKRISELEIDVYFRNGQKAFLEETPKCNSDLEYWNIKMETLKEQIEKYDVISFDIFDTLITRKIYLPADVFRLVELKLKYEDNIDIEFEKIRVRALHTTGKTEPDYDDIYKQFKILSGLTEELVLKIKNKEFEVERSLFVLRKDMAYIFNYAKEMGKKVIIITDMYYSAHILSDFLEEYGINGFDDIFVSSEYGKTKSNGDLFDEVIHKYGNRKILHIGDNMHSDINMAKERGITPFFVMSGRELLEKSSLREIIPHTCTVFDAIILGIIIAKYFNSPFVLSKTKGIVEITNSRDMGYMVYGPLNLGFCHWLYQKSNKDKIEKLLFFARDGYFLQNYYLQIKQFIEKQKKIKGITETEYFYISRRLAAVSSVSNEDDFLEVAKLPYKGAFSDYMLKRWNVDIDKNDELYNELINTAINTDKLINSIKKYGKEVKKSISADKENYIRYVKRHIEGINKLAIVDTWYYGNCQYYLSKMLNASTTGYYFGVNMSGENRNSHCNVLKACYNDEADPLGKKVNCLKYSLHYETIFTAPHGMIRSCTGDNEFIYEAKSKNQQEWGLREEVAKGSEEFISEAMYILGAEVLEKNEFDYSFCDKFYGICWEGGIKPDKEIQSKMYNENFFQSSEEFLIME